MNNACASASHSELKPPETCKVLKPTCLQPWNRAVHVGQGQGNGSTIAPHFAFLKLNFNLTRRDVQPIETPVGPATLSFHREVGRGLHHNAPSLCAQSSQHLPRVKKQNCEWSGSRGPGIAERVKESDDVRVAQLLHNGLAMSCCRIKRLPDPNIIVGHCMGRAA